jgi:hypothetical protein
MTEPYSDELQARFGFDLDLGGDGRTMPGSGRC